jgi:hypothetical protein
MVTTLRASDRGAGGSRLRAAGPTAGGAVGAAASVAPQALQKREPDGGVAPQLVQVTGSRAPQPLQKVEPAGGSCPH